MNSLRRILLSGLSSLILVATLQADPPRIVSGMKYRKPLQADQLLSNEHRANQILPPVKHVIPPSHVVPAAHTKLSDFILNEAYASFQQDDDDSDAGAAPAEEEEDEEATEEEMERKMEQDALLFASLPSMRSVSISAPVSSGIMPKNYASTAFASRSSEFQSCDFQRIGDYGGFTSWCAPSVGYRPLYFEDVWLERHGYNYGCLQPAVSAAKFCIRAPLVPYMMGANPCRECTYGLGLGVPGDCPPHFFTLPKKSLRGALYQAAAVTGTVFVVP